MTKVEELVAKLHTALQNNIYKLNEHFPSEYDLMIQYDVSRSTANKATSILVAEGLLERQGRGGGTLVKAQQIFPEGYFAFISSPHPFVLQIYNGLSQAALERNMMVFQASPGIENLSEFLQMLKVSHCRGIFSCGYGMLPRDCQLPWIDLDGSLPTAFSSNCHVVRTDCYTAAREMITAIGRKYHNIVTLSRPLSLSRSDRQRGFIDGMKDLNIPDAGARHFDCNRTAPVLCRQILLKILQRFPEVDFIATDSDDVLNAVHIELIKMGIEVPRQINLSGFGSIRASHFASVDQHPLEMGAAAMDTMFELLKLPDWRETRYLDIQVPATLVGMEYL